uniref:Nuclear protein, coactivator of histone transcription n=1 Tax=Anas platyrhynchos TaxID=8839 RepID=A0A8B9SFD7_ANAPL
MVFFFLYLDLPKDVVSSYKLQAEKLLATCREFILESSDLKEYAEHCTEDGFIPACLLSLCGKNLTTILNEYVAMKTKETTHEVPAMMSSLWKKLDYTLSQIRSGIVEMKRQRMLQQSAPPNPGLLSVAHQSVPQNSSSIVPPQVIHRPAINQNISQARLNTLLQLVIENAREKILSNKSLQEKLAENINKILGSDGSVTQAPKQTDSGPAEQETSIDEILGLQGEIHMSEEAIQDILEQTESDPAFQALFDLFDYGRLYYSQSGVESTILVDEDNLESLESSLGTEETSKYRFVCSCFFPLVSPRVSFSLFIFHYESIFRQSDCTFQNLYIFSGNVYIQADVLKTVTPEHIGELEIAFDSVPVLTEPDKRQIPDSECSEHCGDAYDKKELPALVSESEKPMEIGKGTLSHSVQNSPNLEYVHSGSPQISLIPLEEGSTASENRMQSGSKCCLSPDTSISEKTLTKSPSDGSPGHSVLLRKNNAPISGPSADAGKEQPVTNETAPLPSILQENSSHHANQQERSMQSDCAARSAVKIPDLAKTELQLEVVDTSNKPYSSDQLDNPKKDFNLPSGPSNSEGAQVEMQEPSSSTKVDADNIYFSPGAEACTEIPVVSTENNLTTSEICHSPLPETASSTDESGTEAKSVSGVSSSSQPMDVDPSNIMSLKIIISDDPFISSDTELNNAVSSITGENLPTIILSSPAKSPTKTTGVDSAEQNLLVLRPKDPVATSVSTPSEDCTVLSVAGTSNLSKEGGFIQLMPATTTLGTAVTPSNVVVLPGNSMPLAAQAPAAVQQLRTPPRSSSTFAANQTVSPNFPQGSAIIIASPVQPVLQGMVGMIPLSVVGQNGNAFSAPARQVLHMPVANPVCNRSIPKLPIPPKSQKIPGARNKTNTGTHLVFLRKAEENFRLQKHVSSE